MITAYDWMKSAREQNNFQKDSGAVLPTLGFYPKILGFFWDIGIFMGFLF